MQGYSTINLFHKTSKTYKAFAACPVTALVHDCVPRDNKIRSWNSVPHVVDKYFIFYEVLTSLGNVVLINSTNVSFWSYCCFVTKLNNEWYLIKSIVVVKYTKSEV